jgi:hypothetical protein
VLDEFVQLLQNRNLIAPGDPAIDLGQVFSDLILAEGTRLELDSEGEIIENHRVQETMLIEKLDPAQAFQTLLPLAKNGQVYAEVKPSLVEKFIGILGAIEALKDIRYTLELMGPAIPKAGGVVERKVLLKHEDTISSDKFQGVVKFCTDVMADPQSRTLFEVDKKIGPEVTIDDCMFRFEPVVVAMGDDGAAKAE